MEQVREILLSIRLIAMWPEMVELVTEATGRERPDWRLPLLAARAIDGDGLINETNVVAAMGCLQTSIILIDDILDNEADGAQQRYGVGKTANLAAAFQAAAIGLASNASEIEGHCLRAVEILSSTAYETAVGQNIDTANPNTEEGYWEMIRAKSGPFYGRSLELGAVLRGASRDIQKQMYELGCIIGEMVQIRDDLTDAMGAPASSDWTEGRANLVLLYGRIAAHGQKKVLIGLIEAIKNTPLNEWFLTKAQQILIEIGAVDYCLHVLEEKKSAGLKLLGEMKLADDTELRHLLNNLAMVLNLDGD